MKVIVSKLSRRLVVLNDKFRDCQKFDVDNLYPQNVSMIIGGSGTATSAADLFARFIIGRGFEKNGDKIINHHWHNLNKVFRRAVRDYSKYYGFALHYNYNANFKIASIQHVPFENCRLGIEDDYGAVSKILVYDDWAMWYKKRILSAEIDKIDIFNPDPEVIESQVRKAGSFRKYKGQIRWFSFEGDYVYPRSPFDPILEDIETDGRIKNFKYKNIVTSFSASHIFVHYGVFESDPKRQEFIDNLNEFQGDENAGAVFLVELDEDEKPPEIHDFKVVTHDKIFEYTEKSIQNNIRKMLRIPPVLIGDLVTGRLGTAEEILDANILYNAFTEDDRKIFEEEFTKALKFFKSPIKSDLKIEPLTIMSEEAIAKRKSLPQSDDPNIKKDNPNDDETDNS